MTTTTRPPRAARTGAPATSAARAGVKNPAAPTRPATRPKPGPAPAQTAKRAAAGPVRATSAAAPRAPFVLLVMGLLGGALVSLLLLNTVLAEDAFTLTKLQRSNKLLDEQRQALQEEIAREESPAVLAQKAKALGMVQPTRPAFVDAQTGRVVGPRVRPVPHAAAAAAGAAGVVAVPGAVVPGDGIPGWGGSGRPAASEGGGR